MASGIGAVLAGPVARNRRGLWGMLIALGAATLGACSDPLPGFANPPAYDAGAEQDASDEDAG